MAVPLQGCVYCKKHFGDHYWVVNGEGALLHMDCFDLYRERRKRHREEAEELMSGLEDDT